MGLYDDDIEVAKKGWEYRDPGTRYGQLTEALQAKKDVGAVITHLSNLCEALQVAVDKFPVLLEQDDDFKKWWAEAKKWGLRIEKDAGKDSNTKNQWDAYGGKIADWLKKNK